MYVRYGNTIQYAVQLFCFSRDFYLPNDPSVQRRLPRISHLSTVVLKPQVPESVAVVLSDEKMRNLDADRFWEAERHRNAFRLWHVAVDKWLMFFKDYMKLWSRKVDFTAATNIRRHTSLSFLQYLIFISTQLWAFRCELSWNTKYFFIELNVFRTIFPCEKPSTQNSVVFYDASMKISDPDPEANTGPVGLFCSSWPQKCVCFTLYSSCKSKSHEFPVLEGCQQAWNCGIKLNISWTVAIKIHHAILWFAPKWFILSVKVMKFNRKRSIWISLPGGNNDNLIGINRKVIHESLNLDSICKAF